ncbi:MAG: hypothetical protein RID53_24710 [Coleofasciculus sp. B1-GNL1-01]|uniref:hypothetical protein n=1 Tax=Coleofasciculus sp. B1-GNL1-01 TaxID=3068484 RepID=UPI0032F400D2
MRSPDTRFMAEAGSQVSTRLQQQFPARLGHAIANSLFPIELEINQPQQILQQLDQPIAQVRDSNSIDPQQIRPAP